MLDRVGKAGANTTSGWCWRRAGPVSGQVSWKGGACGLPRHHRAWQLTLALSDVPASVRLMLATRSDLASAEYQSGRWWQYDVTFFVKKM